VSKNGKTLSLMETSAMRIVRRLDKIVNLSIPTARFLRFLPAAHPTRPLKAGTLASLTAAAWWAAVLFAAGPASAADSDSGASYAPAPCPNPIIEGLPQYDLGPEFQ